MTRRKAAHPEHYEAIAIETGLGIDAIARCYDGKPASQQGHQGSKEAVSEEQRRGDRLVADLGAIAVAETQVPWQCWHHRDLA